MKCTGIITGLSDHTLGDVSVLGAVALGVRVIEKHFTDSTEKDQIIFSMTPTTGVTWLNGRAICKPL